MSITNGERLLLESIGRAQAEIENAAEAGSLEGSKRAWRLLEDGLIAFSGLHRLCPGCSEFLDEGGDCPDPECPWVPETRPEERSHG